MMMMIIIIFLKRDTLVDKITTYDDVVGKIKAWES